MAETLTNLALAYTENSQNTEAAFAIDEAKQFARGDAEQLHRIDIALAHLGLLPKHECRQLLLDAAQTAEASQQFDTAYTRHCIAARLANRFDDPVWGAEVIALAERLEFTLHPSSLDPAKLRFYKAACLERSGAPVADVLRVLIEGARLWCDRLPGKLGIFDYHATVSGMHDHFRKLSAMLHQNGRSEEAFVAFETGRGRSFALEVNETHRHPLLEAKPFLENAIECALLGQLRGSLKSREVVVSVAILPPNLVAFVVGPNGVEVCSVALASEMTEANAFGDATRRVAERLENGTGIDCLPHQVVSLAQEVVKTVANREIVSFAPHAMLHCIPWRALLRSQGAAWAQLPFMTQFSPFLDPKRPKPTPRVVRSTVALGFGTIGAGADFLNFGDEAVDFAGAFGANGHFLRPANSQQVKAALKGNDAVLLSCHGKMVTQERGRVFLLSLADGNFSMDELLDGRVTTPLVILSACSSGVYDMALGDYPIGAAPTLLVAGAEFCVCTRFLISAHFTKALFPAFGRALNSGALIAEAFVSAIAEMEHQGYDLWRHLACVELLARGTPNPIA